jgi:hypothetical protein
MISTSLCKKSLPEDDWQHDGVQTERYNMEKERICWHSTEANRCSRKRTGRKSQRQQSLPSAHGNVPRHDVNKNLIADNRCNGVE